MVDKTKFPKTVYVRRWNNGELDIAEEADVLKDYDSNFYLAEYELKKVRLYEWDLKQTEVEGAGV